jgi:translation initiation factor IF-1
VQKTLTYLALAGAVLAPSVATAATIDASLIPDGTYTVKVEKVVDSKHIQVSMDNGSETTLQAGRPTIDFSKVKPGDQVKLSLGKGAVLVYLDLSGH